MNQTVDEKMNPESSPTEQGKSGVRKVNNVPLYLLAVAVGFFLLIMMLVASDRAANQNKPPEEAALQTVTSATNFAAEIAGQHESGIIQPEGAQTRPVQHSSELQNAQLQELQSLNETDDTEYFVSHTQGDLNAYDRNASSPSASYAGSSLDEDMARFQMMRLQLLEQAVKSKTGVTGFKTGNPGGSTFSGSPQNQLAAIRGERDSLESTRSDPTYAYKAKLEELKSLISGVGGASGPGMSLLADSRPSTGNQSSVPSLSAGGWRLNSSMDNPETPFVLRAGFVIPAVMISGINSDLPGQVMAQISQDVYDTATGRHLILPQGSRLVGSYSSQVIYGQKRVLTAWDRIVFPDGKALDIRGMQGADSAGYSGFKDKVNTHFWKVFSSAFLMSGIVAGVNLSQDTGGGDALNDRQRASDAMSEALGQQLGQAMTQMIMKNLNVAPTLTIRPGYRFNVMVSKDMVFSKPYESFDY